MSAPSEQLERIVGFSRYLEERCAERIFSSFLATALLCESLPLVHDLNYLRVEDAAANANELSALSDRVLGGSGLSHRKVISDAPDIGARLAPQFESLGWEVQKTLVMVHSGELEEEPIPIVAEIGSEDMVPFWEAENRERHPGEEELIHQLTRQNMVIEKSIDCRYFARRAEGKVVSGCQLYSRGAAAQIEAVGTLLEYRNRGLASSVVLHAAREAFATGHDLVWLLAEEDDWPKALYAKLGFSPIGRFYEFERSVKTSAGKRELSR